MVFWLVQRLKAQISEQAKIFEICMASTHLVQRCEVQDAVADVHIGGAGSVALQFVVAAAVAVHLQIQSAQVMTVWH
jgi:hypothetical protein